MLTQEEADSIIDTINERALEVRQLIITMGSIIALLMPAVEILGVIDITPYGEGDDEWIGDDDWEWGDDFTCGDGTRIEASAVDDGYKNCRDGSDEPDEPAPTPSQNNTTVIIDNNSTANQTNNETIEDDCYPMMWDAYYDYEDGNMTIHWDADLSCDDAPHNLTLIWTFYHNNTNETGNWTGIQVEHTYQTYYQDWDFVNITIAVPEGRYDIFSTFAFNGEYSIGTDWFAVEVN